METNDVEDENILFDVNINHEWPLECESSNKTSKELVTSNSTVADVSSPKNNTWASYIFNLKNSIEYPLPKKFIDSVNLQHGWKITVSNNGDFVALLQNQWIEIRCKDDDYNSVKIKFEVGNDPNPNWRYITFDQSDEVIAYSDSQGNVQIYELSGIEICVIKNFHPNSALANVLVNDFGRAMCSIIFLKTNMDRNDDIFKKLITVTYKGSLKCYTISNDGIVSIKHAFNLENNYLYGVTDVIYISKFDILLISGNAYGKLNNDIVASDVALHSWRILSDYPHYKLVTSYDDDIQMVKKNITPWMKLRFFRRRGNNDVGIFKLSLSDDETKLAAIHSCGSISFWDVPSLRLRKFISESEQTLSNLVNPEISANPKLRKYMLELLYSFYPIDINWWNNDSIVLSRCSGSITILNEKSLTNLLGNEPQWFEPCSRISTVKNGCVAILECKRRQVQKRILDLDDDDLDDSDDESLSLLGRSRKYLANSLYYFTDHNYYLHAKKRPRLMNKTYRLITLRSTTPEELYIRKIDLEEYGEALLLANKYDLDTDLVYQRQWKKSRGDFAAIQDYLTKIKKRDWVLNECLSFVPDDIDAARELLEYGLGGIDVETFVHIENYGDNGLFELPQDQNYIDLPPKEIRNKKMLLAMSLNFSKFTTTLKELVNIRLKLLQYFDRLKTYEQILGGTYFAAERFNPDEYKEFRQDNITKAAVDYARSGNWEAVQIIFTYHGDIVLEHRLPILSNFPETFSPLSYRSLLVECNLVEDAIPEVISWNCDNWRLSDWCEEEFCQKYLMILQNCDLSFLYGKDPELENFRGLILTKDIVSEWYKFRAKIIERLSCRIDNAIELLELGMENNVPGLDILREELLTLDLFVYDCQVDENINLEKLQKLTNLEKVTLMMSKSPLEYFAKNIYRWLIPFLDQCERKDPLSSDKLLQTYLIDLAKKKLEYCVIFFKNSKADCEQPIITDEELLLSTGLECIYACENTDKLDVCFQLLECLPELSENKNSSIQILHKKIDEMELCLSAADLLTKLDRPLRISEIKEIMLNKDKTKKLFKDLLLNYINKNTNRLNETELSEMYRNLHYLRNQTFTLFSKENLIELFVECLILSSDSMFINISKRLIERSLIETSKKKLDKDFGEKVNYKRSVEIVVDAAKEYFDASASSSDCNMEFAKTCLLMFHDKPKLVCSEWDLIEAFELLESFCTNTLPVQVRIIEDKSTFIKKVMVASKSAYKCIDKLTKLGQLLKIEKGVILSAIVDAAIKNEDYSVAIDQCTLAIKLNYAPIWENCQILAKYSKTSFEKKLEFLKFASLNCTECELDKIMKLKFFIERDILIEDIRFDNENTTQELASVIAKETKESIKIVASKEFWSKNMLNIFSSVSNYRTVTESKSNINETLEKYGKHAFYGNENDNDVYLSSVTSCYNTLNPYRPSVNFYKYYCVIRLYSLEKILGIDEKSLTPQQIDDAYVNLCQECLPNDFQMAVYFLSCVKNEITINDYLNRLPKTEIVLDLKIYTLCLKLALCLENLNYKKVSFKDLPNNLPQGLEKKLYENITLAKDAKNEFMEAKKLKQIAKGIDADRFITDDKYKTETIFGLVMSNESDIFSLAIQLAKRYNIKMWDIYMAHFEYLFDDAELQTNQIENVIEERNLLNVLFQEEKEFVEKTIKSVFPLVNGTDYERLLLIMKMFEKCDKFLLYNLKALDHIKVLKKLKSLAPELNYKTLMQANENPLEALKPILNLSNLAQFAKIAKHISDGKGGFLTSSSIYKIWAIMQFWSNGSSTLNDKECIRKYDNSIEYFENFLPSDFIDFIDNISFSTNGTNKISIKCRIDINDKALKYSRTKERQMKGDEKQLWTNACKYFERSLNHLKGFAQSEIFNNFRKLEGARKYADLIDICRSDENNFKKICIEAVLDGNSVIFISEMIKVLPIDNWDVKTVYHESVEFIIKLLENDRDKLIILENVAKAVHFHETEWGELISRDDILVSLRKFCSNSNVDSKLRVLVLNLLETVFDLDEDDLDLLILFRTKAIVVEFWPELEINPDDVKDKESRYNLFKKILLLSSESTSFIALSNLLVSWKEYNENIWLEFSLKFIENNKDICSDYLTEILKNINFNLSNTEKLFNSLTSAKLDACAIRIILKTEHKLLYKKVIELLKSHDMANINITNDIIDLILKRHLTVDVISTPYYCLIYNRLMEFDNSHDYLQPSNVANELINAGHIAVGASLLMASKGSSVFRTFSSVLSMGNRQKKLLREESE